MPHPPFTGDYAAILKKYWGHDTFRPLQLETIESVAAGRDTLVLMPTGGGKSVIYQVPALASEGVCIVITPLISLMKDQVDRLRSRRILAEAIHGGRGRQEIDRVLDNCIYGDVKFLYISPERVDSELFRMRFAKMKVSLIAVDEAHCISQWGYDFRPAYLQIARLRDLQPEAAILALTASATPKVAADIMQHLRFREPNLKQMSFARANLSYVVRRTEDKREHLLRIVNNVPGSGIVYVRTREKTETVAKFLQENGIEADSYHGGMGYLTRSLKQENWTGGKTRVIVATNAFGMGIDKADVRFVIHYDICDSLEAYYQEAGRAGRDGAKADCILFYSGQDVITNQFFIEQDRDNEELTGEALEEVRRQDRERLKKMTFYCHTTDCLRDYMLRYFGEFGSNYCGNCSNCLNTFETIDITELANDLISCILTSGMRFGVNVILDTLRGSKNEKVLRFGLDSNRYYATHAQDTIVFLRQVLNYLVLTDYLVVTDDQFPIVKVKEKGLSFYAESGEFRPVLTMKAARKTTQTPAKAGQLPGTDKSGRKRSSLHTGSDPFEALRRLRTEIARAQHIPPYLVFSDKSLESMCVLLPQTKTEMLAVHGVGELKYQKYGEQFLALCQKLAGESEEF